MVLNFNSILIETHNGTLIINQFLDEYENLLRNLKSAFSDRLNEKLSCNEVSCHVSEMKNFVIKKGGPRCVKLLAEYEKNCSIGDYASGTILEKKILAELNAFKESWISMLS